MEYDHSSKVLFVSPESSAKRREGLRDPLTVTGEHDCLGRIRRDVHRDLPATVVLEPLGDKLSRDGHCRCLPSVAVPIADPESSFTLQDRIGRCL
jgi:hypothetical protein